MSQPHQRGDRSIERALLAWFPWFRPGVVLAIITVLAGAVAGGVLLVGLPPADSAPEAGFARDMSVHHAQAVEMADIIRDRTGNPEIRILAIDIALTQQAQIGQMSGWLGVWGLPATGRQPRMAWMGQVMQADALMPGMASPEDLALLRDVPGDKVDAMFLQLMIRHHQGGVDMADGILDRTQRPEVRTLAEAIVVGQRAEIQAMQDLLRRTGATSSGESSRMTTSSHSMHSGIFTAASTTAMDLIPRAFVALGFFAGAWLAVCLGTRRRARTWHAMREQALGSYLFGCVGLLAGAVLHLGLWPVYQRAGAGASLLLTAAAIGMAVFGGALLAQPTRRLCIGGATLAASSITLFVALRLGPLLAHTSPVQIEFTEVVAATLDVIALTGCVLLWHWTLVQSVVVRPVRQSDHGR